MTILYGVSYWVSHTLDPVKSDHRGTLIKAKYFDAELDLGAEVALIGNSMLGWGIDRKQLAAELKQHNKSAAYWAQDGSASSFWYLALKNHVVSRAEKPRAVVLFVLARELTWATFRSSGEQATPLRLMSNDREPEFMRILTTNYQKEKSYTDAGLLWLRYGWPAYGLKFNVRTKVFKHVTGNPIEVAHEAEKGQGAVVFRKSVKRVLSGGSAMDRKNDGVTHYRGKGLIDYYDLEKVVAGSFLPAIERLCAENEMQLIIVRMPRNPTRDLKEPAVKQKIDRYMIALEHYADRQGLAFIDYSAEELFHETEVFSNGHHLGPTGREYLTANFANDLVQLLSDEAGAGGAVPNQSK